MPINDDASIPNDAILLRLLTCDWITKDERPRPTSHAFRDSNFESSCFLDSAEVRLELRRLFAELAIAFAAIPAQVFRDNGFAIESRPDEAPGQFGCDRRSHVVVGPPRPCARTAYDRMARAIARHEQVALFLFLE
jgi:hypothetical protein